jgi:hypothetical protein
MRYVVDFQKARPVESEEGILTPLGMKIAHEYAKLWVSEGSRDLNLEREYPTLSGLFYDIRVDSDLAREHAIEE